MKPRHVGIAAGTFLFAILLTACSPASVTPGPSTPSPSAPSPSPPIPTPSPSPSPVSSPVALPTDCRGLLSESVQTQLAPNPLNDPAFGPGGVQEDGTLICNWGDPRADTTRLSTWISRVEEAQAQSMLDKLANEQGFSCPDADGGIRCEKQWQNTQYPVVDTRSLFWREGILVDTRTSNLSPTGYTESVIEHLFG